ncbi:hypothetical protein PXK00_18570, partial [Phaeobacter sp. QD34_3]|uniref:hypothetical protein n=1 Tax=unclassified Phaeobacter TaxID=2621772 RepID=UPI00237F1F8F
HFASKRLKPHFINKNKGLSAKIHLNGLPGHSNGENTRDYAPGRRRQKSLISFLQNSRASHHPVHERWEITINGKQ